MNLLSREDLEAEGRPSAVVTPGSARNADVLGILYRMSSPGASRAGSRVASRAGSRAPSPPRGGPAAPETRAPTLPIAAVDMRAVVGAGWVEEPPTTGLPTHEDFFSQILEQEAVDFPNVNPRP